jgi:hypothetical protein
MDHVGLLGSDIKQGVFLIACVCPYSYYGFFRFASVCLLKCCGTRVHTYGGVFLLQSPYKPRSIGSRQKPKCQQQRTGPAKRARSI